MRVTNLTKFGAFVQVSEGVEGMIHISDMTAEKRDQQRINHPQEVLRVGQQVKAQVLAVDKGKRQLKLGMKQLVPSGLDEYMAEHKEGDVVTGRMIEDSGEYARVELGEGIQGTCRIVAEKSSTKELAEKETPAESKPDLSSLSSMLKARWKGGTAGGATKPEAVRAGQIRSFRISRLDPAAKRIELELAKPADAGLPR